LDLPRFRGGLWGWDQGIWSEGNFALLFGAILIWGPRVKAWTAGAGLRPFLPSSFFIPVSLFGLRSPFLRPGPHLTNPTRAGPVKDAHLRAREGLVLDRSEHGGSLGQAGAATCDGLGIGLLSGNGKKTAEPYIRSARMGAKPISHILGKEEAGLDGNNLLAGIEAMNGLGHASIPVRRTQLQRAASDKPVTP
jgi:hypothetical protein